MLHHREGVPERPTSRAVPCIEVIAFFAAVAEANISRIVIFVVWPGHHPPPSLSLPAAWPLDPRNS